MNLFYFHIFFSKEAISNMQGDAQRRFDVSRSEFSQVACANEKLPCRNESLRLYRGAMEGTLTPVERRYNFFRSL